MRQILQYKNLLRLTALFLWYFVAIFLIISWDISNGSQLLQEGSFWGDLVVRHPYQWDFELFFAGLFLVWGVFIWKARRNIKANHSLIRFTGWAFIVHAVTMIIAGAVQTNDWFHLLHDSIYWLVLGGLVLYFQDQ